MVETYRKMVVQKMTSNFREAVGIISVNMCHPNEGEVCIKNRYVGLNADDVNFTRGRFFLLGLPCDIGFEGMGHVVSVGSNVENFKVGDKVVYFTSKYNAYAEYCCVPIVYVYQVPEIKPEYLSLVVSGITPSIGLDMAGFMKRGERVMITAAAGGLGHIAVQYAKIAGCHVIGTCSTKEKEIVLKELGCDRVINYRKEDIADVLVKEYPGGIDVIWETVGGKILEACLRNLATKGRLIIAGGISGYKRDGEEAHLRIDISNLPEMVWFRSKSIQGYNVENYSDYFSSYFERLKECYEAGNIRILYSLGSTEQEFRGLEGIIGGIEYLHSGKSIGKILVKLY